MIYGYVNRAALSNLCERAYRVLRSTRGSFGGCFPYRIPSQLEFYRGETTTASFSIRRALSTFLRPHHCALCSFRTPDRPNV